MNQYGAQLRRHWERYRKDELAQIEDQEAFFTQEGQRIFQEIEDLAESLAAEHEKESPTNGDYQAKLAQLETARFEAEAAVMRRELTTPEDDETP